MGTLTSLLHVTTSALAADQAALSATADNISNQNTEGYTRRTVSWSSGDTVSVRGNATSTGVTATVVAQRDRVLQRSVQQATEAASAGSTRVTALNNLQSLFAIRSDGTDASGIGAAMSDFFNSATALASSPTDATARQKMYTAAQTVASTLNTTASQIALQTASLNQNISTSVDQVNALATKVAALNKQISETTANDNTDGLIDQRDVAITQLSKLMDVNSITNSNGSISLALSNGTALVTGSTALPLTTATVGGNVQIYAAKSAGGSNVTGIIRGGSIGGSLQVRDEDIPAVTAQLDGLAAAITNPVNTLNTSGTNLSGAAGGALFGGTTAATIQVVATSSDAIAASPSGSTAAAIGSLQDQTPVGGKSYANAFAGLMSGLGNTASAASTGSDAADAVLTQTSAQLADISGVSLDTEAANLTQYQRSYQAAAKVLAIVNELMAQAINLGQQTSVS